MPKQSSNNNSKLITPIKETTSIVDLGITIGNFLESEGIDDNVINSTDLADKIIKTTKSTLYDKYNSNEWFLYSEFDENSNITDVYLSVIDHNKNILEDQISIQGFDNFQIERFNLNDGNIQINNQEENLPTPIIGTELSDILNGSEINDTIYAESGDDFISGGDGNDIIYGGEGDDYIEGGAGNDTLKGEEGLDTIIGGAGDDHLYNDIAVNHLEGGLGNDTYYLNSDNNTLVENANEGIDKIYSSVSHTLQNNFENLELTESANINGTGNELDNDIIGNAGNNILIGGAGNDSIDGGAGSDDITGGTGNDILLGNEGDDQYKFSQNWGEDTIQETSGCDAIVFDESSGITQSNAIFTKNNDSLEISEQGTNNKITIEDFFTSNAKAIEEIVFSDNSYIEKEDILKLIPNTQVGTSGDDTLIGDNSNNNIFGLAGNDAITGGGGNDSLDGNDGNDSYHFESGFGQDIIRDSSGTDKVVFGGNISKTDLTITKNQNNLEISLKNASDKIVIENWFASDSNKIERLEFADNSFATIADIDEALTNGGNLSGSGDPHFYYNGRHAFDFHGSGGHTNSWINMLQNDDIKVEAFFASLGDRTSTYMTKFKTILNTEHGDITINAINSCKYSAQLNGEDITNRLEEFGVSVEKSSHYVSYYKRNYQLLTVSYGNRKVTFDQYGSAIRTNMYKADDIGLLTQIKNAAYQNYENMDQYIVKSPGSAMGVPVAIVEGADYQALAKEWLSVKYANSTYFQIMTGKDIPVDLQSNIDFNYNPNSDTTRNVYEKAQLCAQLTNQLLANKDYGKTAIETVNAMANWIEYSAKAMKKDIKENEGSIASRFKSGHGYSAAQWNEYIGTLAYALNSDVDKNTSLDTAIDINNDNFADGFDLNNDGILQQNENVIANLKDEKNLFIEGSLEDDIYQIKKSYNKTFIRERAGEDTIKFDKDISKEDIALYMDNKDLVISYGEGDKHTVTIQNQSSAIRTIEKIEVSNGQFMSNNDINKLIQQMTAFATEKGLSISSIDDVKNNQELMTIISNNWHN